MGAAAEEGENRPFRNSSKAMRFEEHSPPDLPWELAFLKRGIYAGDLSCGALSPHRWDNSVYLLEQQNATAACQATASVVSVRIVSPGKHGLCHKVDKLG